MKKAILTITLLLGMYAGFSQTGYVDHLSAPKRISLFGGAGLATSNNYDVGTSAGLDFHMYLRGSFYWGAMLFMQGHSLYYDHEANQAMHGTGYAGAIYRHESKYVFFCPKISKILWSRTNFIPWVYLYGGAGFKMSGYDSLRKWDNGLSSTDPRTFDSTIDASKNLNSMALRVGLGFAQDIYMGRNFWFTFKEDFGFMPTALTSTGGVNGGVTRTEFMPNKINPGYISLQLGITYIKAKQPKYKSK